MHLNTKPDLLYAVLYLNTKLDLLHAVLHLNTKLDLLHAVLHVNTKLDLLFAVWNFTIHNAFCLDFSPGRTTFVSLYSYLKHLLINGTIPELST